MVKCTHTHFKLMMLHTKWIHFAFDRFAIAPEAINTAWSYNFALLRVKSIFSECNANHFVLSFFFLSFCFYFALKCFVYSILRDQLKKKRKKKKRGNSPETSFSKRINIAIKSGKIKENTKLSAHLDGFYSIMYAVHCLFRCIPLNWRFEPNTNSEWLKNR